MAAGSSSLSPFVQRLSVARWTARAAMSQNRAVSQAAPDLLLSTDGVAVRRLGRAKRLAWLAFGFFAAITLLSPYVGAAVSLAGILAGAASAWALLRLHFAHPISDPRGM